MLELERVGGLSGARIEVGVVDRQRIVGERNAGDVGVEQRQLLGRECRQPDVVRARAYRAGMTRILGSGISGSAFAGDDTTPSAAAIDPDARRRQVHPDALGGLALARRTSAFGIGGTIA